MISSIVFNLRLGGTLIKFEASQDILLAEMEITGKFDKIDFSRDDLAQLQKILEALRTVMIRGII